MTLLRGTYSSKNSSWIEKNFQLKEKTYGLRQKSWFSNRVHSVFGSLSLELELFSDLHRRRQWHPTPVLLPGKSHGQRSLVGCSPWGCWGSDTTERLHFYFSLSCIGEGSGNPLQCSCLENPRDGEAWLAAISGVAQSQTRLKRLSSSSSDLHPHWPLTLHVLDVSIQNLTDVSACPKHTLQTVFLPTLLQVSKQLHHPS